MLIDYKIVDMAANGANANGAAAGLTGVPANVFTTSTTATSPLEAAKAKVNEHKDKLLLLKDSLKTKTDELAKIPSENDKEIQDKITEINSIVPSFYQTFETLKDSLLVFVTLKFQDLDKQKASGDKYKALFTSALGIISKISDGVVKISTGVGQITDKVTGQVRAQQS